MAAMIEIGKALRGRLAAWSGLRLRREASAALTGACVALPQGIAFATIAGLPPEYGVYATILLPVIAALFGASPLLIAGPSTATSVLVFSALHEKFAPGSPDFINAALCLGILVGVMQIAMGLARVGVLSAFVSPSVMMGFTAGAALSIAGSQLTPAFGVSFAGFLRGPDVFLTAFDARSAVICVTTLVVVLAVKRMAPRAPHFLVGLIWAFGLATVMSSLGYGVAMVSAMPSALPSPASPSLSAGLLRSLAPDALPLAIVALLQTVSVAKIMEQSSVASIPLNRNFIAGGAGNVAGGLASCVLGCVSLTRSAVNAQAGGATQLAPLLSSLLLLLAVLFDRELIALIPVAGISALVIVVAFSLLDVRGATRLVRTSLPEAGIALVTLGMAIIVSLPFSIYVGVILSLAYYLQRTSQPVLAVGAPDPSTPGRPFRHAQESGLAECPQLVWARVDGPLYFGSAPALDAKLRALALERPAQKQLIIGLRGIGELDLPAASVFLHEVQRRKARQGGALYLVARFPALRARLLKFGVIDAIGPGNLFTGKHEALSRLVPQLDQSICATCEARIFLECPARPLSESR
ncbi:MAG: SulP family inorganic anion transporter [Beijerinckiaceae bacterium]|nr:SulP family inorganic anion transporter [Beijerinckiaceae bacterium]